MAFSSKSLISATMATTIAPAVIAPAVARVVALAVAVAAQVARVVPDMLFFFIPLPVVCGLGILSRCKPIN